MTIGLIAIIIAGTVGVLWILLLFVVFGYDVWRRKRQDE